MAAERPAEDILYAPAFPARTSDAPPPITPHRPLFSHVSGGVEIACVQRGSALVVTPGQILRMTPGKLLVIERGVQHAEFPGRLGHGHRMFWCHLYQTRAHLSDTWYSPTQGLGGSALDLPGRTNVERIGQSVCSELAARAWGYPRAVHGLLTYLACLHKRPHPRGSVLPAQPVESLAPVGGHKTRAAIQAALEYCAENFRRGLSREEVARAVGYSASHLGHLVSTQLGHSLSEYLNNLRISEGRRLLEDSDLTVREIAASIGYTDAAHFTRAFRRATGASPTAYRRQLGLL
mgnify:FL=1